LRAVRLILVTLASAIGGSVGGTAMVLLPGAAFLGGGDDRLFAASIVFAISLPFTVVGATLLTAASHLLRDALGTDWLDYGGILIAAMLLGALMPLPLFGPLALFFGVLFALVTAGLWAVLYRAFALPADIRDPHHG
jgi:hypothetical protein